MTDSLIQCDALILLKTGLTIKADVFQAGDERDPFLFARRDMDIIRVRPSNWPGADWSEIRR